MTLVLLTLLLQDSPYRVSCECGAWIEPQNGTLLIGYEQKTIAAPPIYRGQTTLTGKPLDLTKPNKVKCPCKKTVEIPALFKIPTGTFTCGECKGGWEITESSLTLLNPNGSKGKSHRIENGYGITKKEGLNADLPELIDLLGEQDIACICRKGKVRIRETEVPSPGGPPPAEEVKSGKKLGTVSCACGGKMVVHEGLATISFNNKEIATVPVAEGVVVVMGFAASLELGSQVTCACGEDVPIPAMKK